MNKKIAVTSVLFIALMVTCMFSAMVSTAKAQNDYNTSINIVPGKLIVTWWFQCTDQWGLGSFDGRTIIRSSIVCMADNTVVKPLLIVITKDYVFIFFWNESLPTSASATYVFGSLTTGDSFDATGPGWTYGHV